MATIDKRAIATTKSNHFCPGPAPAMSLSPPTPPAGPVPAPFAYVALSSSATATQPALTVGGAPVLVDGSSMAITLPGNAPCQPTGGDVVTHVVNRACGVFTGSSKLVAGGRPVACTGDSVRMNVPFPSNRVAQTIGMLMMALPIAAASHPAVGADLYVVLDPISVVSGAVVDESVDLAIPGLIPVAWTRRYSSARVLDRTPLGRGGWTHSYHQWIEADGERLRFHDADGVTLEIPLPEPDEPVLLRGRRLVLTCGARSSYTLFSIETRLTRTYQPLGGRRAYLREIADASGQRVVLEYESERLVRIFDTARRRIVLTHDADGHIVKLEAFGRSSGSPAHVVTFGYGEGGELSAVTDPLGAVESYAYDEQRRLTRKTLPTGLSFHYRYDTSTGRCVRSWGDGGLHAGDLAYESDAGVTRLTGALEPRVFNWRPDGMVVREASPDGSFARELAYDADGLLIEEKNAAGDATTFEYDARGNLTRVVGALGPLAELEHQDDLLRRRRIGGSLTTYHHDHLGRLTAIDYATGASLRLSYDEHGRLAAVHGPDGLRGAFVYDDEHNVIEERTARGGVRRWRYDAMGRPIAHVDVMGRQAWRELDALGRPIAVRLPDGGSQRFEYDALGRLTRRVDAMGRAEVFRHAGLRSPIEVVLPDDSVWSLGYDLNERLQQVKNPKGETFDLRYDRAGNLRELRSFDGRVLRARHGKNGRLAHVELPDGAFRALHHDGAGMVVAEETPHGSVRMERRGRTVEYHLDDPALPVTVTFEHDEHGRVIAETQNGRTIRYVYDAQNRCTERRLPTGQVTRYAYDAEGNVAVVEHGGHRVELQRDLAGTVIRRAFGSGLEARRVVDASGRPVRDWVGKGDQVLVDRSYAYDAVGALLARRDTRWGESRYQHDELGMLRAVTSPKLREAFEYDAGGAPRRAGADWEVAPGGLLVRTEEAEYEYDEASRRTRETRRDGSVEYLWDCRGQLREVRRSDGSAVKLGYDPFGRRIRKEIVPRADAGDRAPSRVIEYLWDGPNLAAEVDSERGLRVFVHEPGTMVPLLHDGDGGVHAVITDLLGTPTELVAPDGHLAWSARHSAWGAVVETAGDGAASPFRLLGQYHDEETGLCYVRHRYFDPSTARFLSPDPLELLGGRNLFAFNGSPATHVDPLGLACVFIGSPTTDGFIRHCMTKLCQRPGEYTVVVHGLPNAVTVQDANGGWSYLTSKQLVATIEAAGNYDGRGALVLNSCNTGRLQHGVGQELSAAYPQAWVRAPSDVVWGLGEGISPPLGVQDSSKFVPVPGTGPLVPDPRRPGQWNHWYNGAPQGQNRYDQYT